LLHSKYLALNEKNNYHARLLKDKEIELAKIQFRDNQLKYSNFSKEMELFKLQIQLAIAKNGSGPTNSSRSIDKTITKPIIKKKDNVLVLKNN